MKIKDNRNLKLGFPGGAYSGADELKFDYSGLVIKSIDRGKENLLRFYVLHGNNEFHVPLRAENKQGEKDLKIVEENKKKLVDKTIDEAINIDL